MGRAASRTPPGQAGREGPGVVVESFDPARRAAQVQFKRKTETPEEAVPCSDQQPTLRRSKRVRAGKGHPAQQTESAAFQGLQTLRITKPIARPSRPSCPSPHKKPTTAEVLNQTTIPGQPETPACATIRKLHLLTPSSPSCYRSYSSAATLPTSAQGPLAVADTTYTRDAIFAAPQQSPISPPTDTRPGHDHERVPFHVSETPDAGIPFNADLFNELLAFSSAGHSPDGALGQEQAASHGLDETQDALLPEAGVREEARRPMADASPSQPSLGSRVLNNTCHADGQDSAVDGFDEEYDLDPATEEDMLKLLEPKFVTPRPRIPPSTTIRGMDADSSAEAFDPTLQFSSPKAAAQFGDGPREQKESVGAEEEDLLGSDVDWDEAMTAVKRTAPETPDQDDHLQQPEDPAAERIKAHGGKEPADSIRDDPAGISTALAADNRALRVMDTLSTGPLRALEAMHEDCVLPMAPFARPPFPGKARRRSLVVGLSSSVVMRTCFRIGELLNEGARLRKQAAQPTPSIAPDSSEAVFELFALVTYSSREPGSSRVQHFQFRDLFKDQLPYPTGTLQGWNPNSLLDHRSRAFLGDAARMKMCRCMCKLRREKKSGTGWHIAVLAIRETGWDEIAFLKRIICSE